MKTGHPYIAGGTTEQREVSYRHITRGWWWRGFLVGGVLGWCVGAIIVAALFRLTGNL